VGSPLLKKKKREAYAEKKSVDRKKKSLHEKTGMDRGNIQRREAKSGEGGSSNQLQKKRRTREVREKEKLKGYGRGCDGL